MNNSNLPQHKLITSLSKHCQKIKTALSAVNKRLTRIISNGSLIINRLCDTCEYTETMQSACTKDQRSL